MMNEKLEDAVAQIKDWSFDGWQASAFEGAAISTTGREAIATVLNAIAAGDLVPASERDALREVFERWSNGSGFNEDNVEDADLLVRAATLNNSTPRDEAAA